MKLSPGDYEGEKPVDCYVVVNIAGSFGTEQSTTQKTFKHLHKSRDVE